MQFTLSPKTKLNKKSVAKSLLGLLLLSAISFGSYQQFAVGENNTNSIKNSTLERQQTGKSKDGKAFRLDSSGNKIFDYLAEMEVSLQELRDEIAVLKNDLKKKDEEVYRLQQLTAKKESTSLPNSTSATETTSQKHSEINSPVVSRTAHHSSEELKKENTVASSKDCERFILPLNQQVARLENIISAKEDEFRLAQEQNSSLEQKLHQAENSLLSSKSETKKFEEALAEQRKTRTRLQSESSPLNNEPQQATPPKKDPIPINKEQLPATKLLTAPQTADSEAIKNFNTMRTKFDQQIVEINKAVLSRKNASDNQKKLRPMVSISLRPLIAKSGRSIDELRIQVQQLTPNSDFKQIESDLASLSQILSEEIRILEGLTRSGY